MRLLLVALLVVSSAAYAAEKPVSITLQNPGFEDELKGWDNADSPEFVGVFSIDGGIKHGGKGSLHIQPQMPEQWPWISQKVPAIQPGAMYVLKAWHQGGTEPNTSTCVAVRLEFLTETGDPVGSRYSRRRVAMQQWQEVGLETQAPLAARSAVVYLRLMGDTEAWLDDVELLRTRPAPPLVLTLARMALKPAETQTVRLQVTAAEDLAEDALVEVKLLAQNDKPVNDIKGQLERQDARNLAGDFTLPNLTAGRYQWQVKAGALSAQGLVFVAAPKKPTNLSDRGVMLLPDGKPIFPIGMYHASVADYRTLSEQGFNIVQGLGTHEKPLLAKSVQEAQAHKLLVEIPLHIGGMVGANLVPSQEKLPYFKKSPVVVSWKVADEPDQHPEVADEVPEVYSRLKQRDQQRPLLLTVQDPATYDYWARFCDSLQIVAFPLPDNPMSLVAERTRQARAALAPWQHLSVLLPAGWRTGGGTQPTFEQARLMVYLVVINGARGVWWYAMRAPGWQLVETELWGQFKRLNEETAALGNVAINGAEVALESDNPKLQAAAWKAGDKLHIAVANPGAESLTATLKAEGTPEQAHVAQGQAQVEVKDGALQVTVAPGGAALIAPGEAAKKPEKPAEPEQPAEPEKPQKPEPPVKPVQPGEPAEEPG